MWSEKSDIKVAKMKKKNFKKMVKKESKTNEMDEETISLHVLE